MIVEHVIILFVFIVIIKGRRSVISTSKMRKIIAIKKKCIEKGSRDDDFGSKPHSNGDLFSRSMIIFFAVRFNIIIRIILIAIIIIERDDNINITFTIF